jgi:hypothetical protein
MTHASPGTVPWLSWVHAWDLVISFIVNHYSARLQLQRSHRRAPAEAYYFLDCLVWQTPRTELEENL